MHCNQMLEDNYQVPTAGAQRFFNSELSIIWNCMVQIIWLYMLLSFLHLANWTVNFSRTKIMWISYHSPRTICALSCKFQFLARTSLNQCNQNHPPLQYLIRFFNLHHPRVMSDHLGLSTARILFGQFSQNLPYPWCFLSVIFHQLTPTLLLGYKFPLARPLSPTVKFHCPGLYTK